MDNIEITVFDEINDYKEKIYFFNIRQWIFAIMIVALVVPIYIFLKDEIGEEITSYIVIAIAGTLGFIGFVKIHELPAEKILPYWFRHYFVFAKPIHYMTDREYEEMRESKKKKRGKGKNKVSKVESKEIKDKQKQEKLLNKKFKKAKELANNNETIESTKINETLEINVSNENNTSSEKDNNKELVEKLSKLTKEEQDVLLKLLGR